MVSRTQRLITYIACLLTFCSLGAQAQTNVPAEEKPVIQYTGTPKKYIIQDIQVEGVKGYEDHILINISGLEKGEEILVPGDDITNAIKRYWKHGLFSNAKISAEKIEGNKIWLKITLTQRPRISAVNYFGVKKSERKDLEARLGMTKGMQITPNTVNRAKLYIKKYFDEKGFKDAVIGIVQKEDPEHPNQVFVDINIDKKEKIKVNHIEIAGNNAIKTSKLKRVMKKTNEKGKLINLFRTKKFVDENFKEDKKLIIDKYNELGYRDAQIEADSVWRHDDKSVDIYLKIDEGPRYYLRNVSWVGNTLYNSDFLNAMLQMKKGDIYNQKLLMDRVIRDDDAIANLYYNNGYLFSQVDPVEVNIVGDSIDLEMRITEGQQATINKINISGNDRLYENVVRRELRIKPGQLFSREKLIRSLREIQQTGHFDPEKLDPQIQPDPNNGTVDIGLPLTTKTNDQVEFSAGWGQTGIVGKISLRFTNFSMENLFKRDKNRKLFLPQGDGQTLQISGQTNARYYQSYSISFMDPWFGGKRPNAFSATAYYSRLTALSNRYYQNMYNRYNSMYYNPYGYGGYGGYNSWYDNYESYYDPDRSMQTWGVSLGWGMRLNWPDDFFGLNLELSFLQYRLKDWQYLPVQNGISNDVNLGITLQRNSVDNPIYPRSGSTFSLSLQVTPPYSLLDKKDYKSYYREDGSISQENKDKLYRWMEYHKWKLKAKTFIPLMDYIAHPKTLVLMTRAEVGLVGHFNKYKRTPFNTFDVGGDGMTGYSTYATESIALRGYQNSSLTDQGNRPGYAYTRLALELRYPLMLETSTNIYILSFLEAGNAWEHIKDFNPFDLKRSAGVGVRIFLPYVGMMGIDWGYGFDKVFNSKQYGGSQFHFILGQEF